MTRQRNLTSRKTKRSTILHFWNNGERSGTTISHITKIPLSTVKYNIAKIKQQSRIEDRPQSDRSRKLTINDRKALSQWIRRNKEITKNSWQRSCFRIERWMCPNGQYNGSSNE